MQMVDGELVVSATDLTRFVACRHLTRLDLEVASGERVAPAGPEEALEALFRRGLRHERTYLERLRRRGLSIIEIDPAGYPAGRAGLEAAQADTVAAMAAGADVVHQATLFDGAWRGHADFLLRRPDRRGAWGWSYDVADTKLGRRMTVAALLQMSLYAERLGELQGIPPERLVVVTGDGSERSFRYQWCSAYARALRERLLAFLAEPAATDPQPIRHCTQCRWRTACRDRWVAEDRVTLVAQLRPRQARALRDAGIGTLTALAAARPAEIAERVGATAAERLVTQARLQLEERNGGGPRHQVLAPEPGRGLALLPAPSEGDVFFDIEGDPYVGDDGLEYLFGVVGSEGYRAFWATHPDQERAALEALVDHLMAAWRADPGMHVYHYAAYEPTRLKALSGRYDTRVEEVDRLLRGERLIDLYTVVKQGVQVGKESYSLKKLEDHYWGHGRQGAEVGDALGSIVAFERWLLAGDGDDDPSLEGIRAYNEADCRSTQALRDWLEVLRREAGGDPVFGRPEHGEPSPDVPARADRSAAVRSALSAGLPIDPPPTHTSRPEAEEVAAVRLLAALMDWHRREALPAWADHVRRRGAGPAELVPDPVALGGLGPAREVGRRPRSVRWRLDFPPQDTALAPGDRGWCDPVTGEGSGTVVEVDRAGGRLVVERAADRRPTLTGLVPPGLVDTRVLADRLAALGEWVGRYGIDAPAPEWRAARDLLLRRPPGESAEPGEGAADRVLRLAAAARDGEIVPGYLAVQGPPGTGTTRVAAQVVLEALAAGRRVGVCAFSHAAISGLLRAVLDGARSVGRPVPAIQKAERGRACRDPWIRRAADNAAVVRALQAGEVSLVAGTAWLFADPGLHDLLDVLVVDEAGQLSLANVVAVSGSARRLVLFGDPQQVNQPVVGVHPPGAGGSALEHVLDGRATVPVDGGVLLDTTYRMHPAVAAFVSDLSYDGRVRVAAGRERQRIESAGALRGSGLRWVPLAGDPAPDRHAEAVAGLVQGLLGDGRWVDHAGAVHRIGPADVLVLTPHNDQARRLRHRLEGLPGGDGIRVGPVDVLQGAQAPVVLYDLARRPGGDAGRGVGFALDRNRFTVALSRASALVAVIADPDLLFAPVRTPEELMAVDALCRYAERAEHVREPAGRADEGRAGPSGGHAEAI